MPKQVSATAAKNNFGGLLEDVASLGRVEIVRHGRLVAVVVSPREFEALAGRTRRSDKARTHMIPSALARAARVVREPNDFEDRRRRPER
jgi:prevent-host-death family protein